MKLVKKITIINLILIFILLLSGCGIFETHIQSNEYTDVEEAIMSEDFIVVGVSQLGSESQWRTANTASVQNALSRENGFFSIMNNARQKQENQIKAIRSYISQKVDYIVVAPLLEDGWENTLQEAKKAGIPVILMDRKVSADPSLYVTSVGTDKWAEGESAAKCLENILRQKGMSNSEINIVALQGTQGSSAQLGRTMGFASIAKEHENWNILEQVDAEFTTIKGKEVMRDFLQKYNDIDVVISQNDDMTFGALDAINEAGFTTGVNGDIKIISFDACKEALQMVSQGIINVDIECNPLQGDYISDVINSIEKNETIKKEYIVDEMVFTKENVSEYLEERAY